MSRWLWPLLPLALALSRMPNADDGFLADGTTLPRSLAWWAESGEVVPGSRHFGAGIAPEPFYRPLPIASFALNFVAGGADPVGWRARQCCPPSRCGALIAALAPPRRAAR